MGKKITELIFIIILGLVIYSCAREKVESEKDKQERVLDAYISEYFPLANKKASGLTILDYSNGNR